MTNVDSELLIKSVQIFVKTSKYLILCLKAFKGLEIYEDFIYVIQTVDVYSM